MLHVNTNTCYSCPCSDVKNLCDNLVKALVGKTSEGFYQSWGKDPTHRQQCKTLGVFESIWPEQDGPFPWRLDKDQRLLLDSRLRRVMWPHYMEPLAYKDASFWKKPGRMWKARRKFRLLFYVLPTCLRDQVSAVRHAFTLFAWAMRRLDGQAYCYDVAQELGVLPGSPVLV